MLPTNWPKWTLFLIALGMTVTIIMVGLILEPIGLALAPTPPAAEELPTISYAKPLSTECESCHTDRQALLDSGARAAEVEALYISAVSLESPHGSLGCVTCHDGTGGTADPDSAHAGLRTDLAETHPADCVVCHRNLPDQIPEDHLRTPHGQITNGVWEGSACGVLCTECHGQIGHGLDPVTGGTICPMSACTNCHGTQNLNTQLTQCSTCHVGPHTFAGQVVLCEDCHLSTETWHETATIEHELPMVGKHAELSCFTCHRWPEFTGLDVECSTCHNRPHAQGNDRCALCHTPEWWEASVGLVLARTMDSSHPAEGVEGCRECHSGEGGGAVPSDHEPMTEDTCQACHAPQFAPAILHPVEERAECLSCHGQDQVAQFPYATHKTFEESLCRTCHAPGDAEPMAIAHTTDRRSDCLFCHGPVRIAPYPADHAGRENNLCLLCHEPDSMPTATLHLFPADHKGAAGNCDLCHPGPDFQDFQCQTCHSGSTIETIHGERGVKLEEDCTLCHPEGKKPLSSG